MKQIPFGPNLQDTQPKCACTETKPVTHIAFVLDKSGSMFKFILI